MGKLASWLSEWLDPKLIVPIVQAVVVLMLGWWTKDSVTLALEQKELDLANVKEMRELLRDLLKPDQNPEEYTAAAVALAPFGVYSMVPFLHLVQDGSDSQALAAEMGLRAVAISEPEKVSELLLRIVNNRSGFYTWNAHLFAIRALGRMGDPAVRPDLVAYQGAIGAGGQADSARLRRFQQMVRSDKPPGQLHLQKVAESLAEGLYALDAQTAGAR